MDDPSRRVFIKTVPAAVGAASLWSAACSRVPAADEEDPALTLWYRQAAAEWTEALPVGCGRLGAMVFGGVERERLQLNEDTLWSGPPGEWNNPEAAKHLPEIRRLVLEQKDYVGATKLCEKMQGPYTQSYQPLGDLYFDFDGIEVEGVAEYRRELSLDSAVARVFFRQGDAAFRREVFASAVDQVIAARIECDRPGRLNFRVSLDSRLRSASRAAGNSELVLEGKCPVHVDPNYLRDSTDPIIYDDALGRGMHWEARCRIRIEGGRMIPGGGDAEMRVEGADAATILVAAATGFRGFDKPPDTTPEEISRRCEATLAAVEDKSYEEMRDAHVRDHRSLFRRVHLDLGATPAAQRPTDERVRAGASSDDPQLAALYFQFGRYLLIASSRPGTQPANLQGIWNDSLRPPWSSNWTLNINAEMNYWLAETCNLAELHEPLFDLIDELSRNGRETARVNYGLGGWTAHHNTDVWRQSAPVGAFGKGNPMWANWPMSAAWLCAHLWEHYAFGLDREFLRNRAYPLIKGAAEFCLDFLVEDSRGRLVTCPSTSPENPFVADSGQTASVSAAATMDLALTREIFTNCIRASEILEADAEFRGKLTRAREKLYPYQIADDGRLMEWWEDFEEQSPGHRHVSHLYPLHPGNQFTVRGTPTMAAAARKSLEGRLAAGSGHTGWSRAWIINLWARLEEGELTHENIIAMLSKSTLPNLLDNHPPFQIDGNFGGTAGIAEALLQSHAGEISILPALPAKAWPQGEVRGLRARGGAGIDIAWRRGRAVSVRLHSDVDAVHRVRPPRGQSVAGVRRGGERVEFTSAEDAVVELSVRAGETYDIEFS